MNIVEYVSLAIRTEKPLSAGNRLEHSCMGLITEVGEVTTELKRMAIYEKPLDAERKAHIAEEIGDVLWYVAIMLDVLQVDLNSFAEEPIFEAPALEGSDGRYQALAMMLGEHVGRLCLLTQTCLASEQVDGDAKANLLESISRILICCIVLAKDCDTTFGKCMEANIAKLRIRYPNAYSNEAAEGRADKAGADARNS